MAIRLIFIYARWLQIDRRSSRLLDTFVVPKYKKTDGRNNTPTSATNFLIVPDNRATRGESEL